jgi:hypothetical protein
MARFVKLTQDNTSDVYHVNTDHIIRFWKAPSVAYTVVELTDGSKLTVKQSPDDLHVMVGS